ncbi:MAG: DUF4350 domain-containing protein [Lyngbya sp. HA4199-MV5]|jgi:hypothetical protein|nr:DUF4350 domain-containing protein [Lyngbya sp. HA4199-MV5]
MALSKRQLWILAIALATLVVISLFAAPGGNWQQSGSTYGRSPDGYGAWYALMESRGVTIHRWQKPLKLLFQPEQPQTPAIETFSPDTRQPVALPAIAISTPAATSAPTTPITLLQISNGTDPLSSAPPGWLSKGNVLVQLGSRALSTQAPFDSTIDSPVGSIRIQTSRRHAGTAGDDKDKIEPLLSDAFGAIVWQRREGQTRVIDAATPHLAANAYQEPSGNFEFLAKLVTEPGLPIWVDEYSHGYKDAEVIKQESSDDLIGYLAKTPLLLVTIQAVVILLVLIWGQNQRLGPAITLSTPSVDNSEAYIQALAAVLQKAESSQFVINTICKAEQLDIQKSLGLGTESLPLSTLVNAWITQTGQPPAMLEAALNPLKRPRHASESELLTWLDAIHRVRQQLRK